MSDREPYDPLQFVTGYVANDTIYFEALVDLDAGTAEIEFWRGDEDGEEIRAADLDPRVYQEAFTEAFHQANHRH